MRVGQTADFHPKNKMREARVGREGAPDQGDECSFCIYMQRSFPIQPPYCMLWLVETSEPSAATVLHSNRKTTKPFVVRDTLCLRTPVKQHVVPLPEKNI